MRQLSNLTSYFVTEDVTLRDALIRLNESELQFLLVVDSDRRLLGTVTDGDIRRGVLRGVQLEDSLSQCVHSNPLVARHGSAKAKSLLHQVPFVPVLDEAEHVTAVLLRDSAEILIKEAVVMAGGLGTRLGSITKQTPKPLLPVGGRPILDHILESLELSGVQRIWIAVNHLSEQIEKFAQNRRSTAQLEILSEDRKLGTAGALGLITDRPAQPFFVVNGDVLTDTDFRAMSTFHRKHDHEGTIAVAHHQIQVPFGVVRHDAGLFSGIDEKPMIRHFVAAGIYLFAPEILSLVPRNQQMDMPDLLNEARSVGLRLGLFPIHEYWTDVGRPEDLSAADERHRQDVDDA